MKRCAQLTFMIFLVLGIAACSPATAATQDAGPLSPPASADVYHPLTVKTGVAEIDRVLEVLAGGDARQLRSLIQFTNAKCTQADGLGGPPKCGAGEIEGMPVEVLPFLGPEGSFLRKDEIEQWQGIDVAGVYAIYEVSSDVYTDEYYPAGTHAILLAGGENRSPLILRLLDGRIVRIDYLSDPSPEALKEVLEREAGTMILPPLKP